MTNTTPGFPENISVPKDQARRLVGALGDKLKLSHAQSLEVIAKVHGQQSWGHMRAQLVRTPDGDIKKDNGPHDDTIVLHNVLFLDFVLILKDLIPIPFWADRAVSLLHAAWPHISLSDDVSVPVDRIEKEEFREAIHKGDGPDFLIEKLISSFDRLHALILRSSGKVSGKIFFWSEIEDKLHIEGFGSRNEPEISWQEAFSTRRHTILYAHDLDQAVLNMERCGHPVHDLKRDKNWRRLAAAFNMPAHEYALGSSGLSRVLGARNTRVLDEKLSIDGPTQVVILSLREALLMNVEVMLAQARALNVHVVFFWDMGAFPNITENRRQNLVSISKSTRHSLVLSRDGSLRVHRAAKT